MLEQTSFYIIRLNVYGSVCKFNEIFIHLSLFDKHAYTEYYPHIYTDTYATFFYFILVSPRCSSPPYLMTFVTIAVMTLTFGTT